MTDESPEITAAAEHRAAQLLRAGTACIALSLLCVLSLPLGAIRIFSGAWLIALAAGVLGLWARTAAPANSPARTTGLVLGLVGLVLALPLGAMANFGQ